MESKRFVKDVSANTLQVLVTQITNLLIFYLISKYISKEDFGFYNWSVALSATIITILSLGMDLVYVKRVATDTKAKTTVSLHFFHNIFSGLVLVVIATICCLMFFDTIKFNVIFLLILINQTVLNITNSIKLCLNGYEKYDKMALIAIITSVFRIALIVVLLIFNLFTLRYIVLAFTLGYIFEFFVGYFISGSTLDYFIKPQLNLKEYKLLIVESLPQLGTVVCDTALARIDWILMGIITTSVMTAEYSFAFKIFEVSKMPFLIIAPILLTRFSKLFKEENNIKKKEKKNLDNLFRLELFIGVLIPVVAIVVWTDFIDLITDNKYGAVNQITYSILAICVPLHFVINFLWTMAFSQGQLKMIFKVTILTAVINISLNILLINMLDAKGAALGFLISTIIQLILYLRLTIQERYTIEFKVIFLYILLGGAVIAFTYWLPVNFLIRGAVAFAIFISLARLGNLISIKILKSAFI